MNKKLVNYILTVIEISGIAVLGSKAIEAEWKRRKAQSKLFDTEMALFVAQMDGVLKDAKIKILEKELNKLKQTEEA